MEDKTGAQSAKEYKIRYVRLLGAVSRMREAQKRWARNNMSSEFVDVKEWYEAEIDNMLIEEGYPEK